jgi:hypothetical protein
MQIRRLSPSAATKLMRALEDFGVAPHQLYPTPAFYERGSAAHQLGIPQLFPVSHSAAAFAVDRGGRIAGMLEAFVRRR